MWFARAHPVGGWSAPDSGVTIDCNRLRRLEPPKAKLQAILRRKLCPVYPAGLAAYIREISVRQGMGRLEKIVVATFAIVFTGCIYVAWVISQPTESPRPFDPVKWEQSVLLDTSNDPGCFRGGMALDLIDRKTLSGKTGHEVAYLLGTPQNSSSGPWLYPVGQCGFFWGHYDLKVTFGADGRVKHADITDSI